jgi:AcrR family transcriptional regulator
MSKIVKSKARMYRSPLRMAQAGQTRTAILLAARELFVEQGWSGTTITAVAAAASVSNETVYSVFGTKRAILQAVVEHAVRGPAADVPLAEQFEPQAIAAETDQRRQIAIFADHISEVLSRVAPIVAVVRSAAETDPEIAHLYDKLHQGRRRNLSIMGDALARSGPLRSGMDGDAATAVLWRLASPELFLLLHNTEGMSESQYAAWLRTSLEVLLLG